MSSANIGKFKLSLNILILSVFAFIFFLVFSNAFRRTKIFCAAFRNHQREGDEGVVSYSFMSVWAIKYAILLHEPKEEHGSNTFVAIAERMVLHYKIQQHGCLFFYRRIKVLAAKSLIYLSYAASERIIFFICKPSTFAKLHFQGVDGIHGILVGGVEKFLLGCLLNAQCLIIVAVECVEGIDIIRDYTELS